MGLGAAYGGRVGVADDDGRVADGDVGGADGAGVTGSADPVEAARAACARLRWHPALRRSWPAVRLEVDVRAVAAGLAMDGARAPVARVREIAAGDPGRDPVDAAALAALRVRSAAVRGWPGPGSVVPAQPFGQLLVGLHLAAGGDGRLRAAGPPGDLRGLGPAPAGAELGARLVDLGERLGARGPGLESAAAALLGLALLRPFADRNAVVARAVFGRLVVTGGLDPAGLAAPEPAWADAGQSHLALLAGASAGGWDAWLAHCASAVAAGARLATRVADGVLAGRLAD